MQSLGDSMRAAPRWLLRHAMLEVALLAICAVLAVLQPTFLSADNLLDVLQSVSAWGIIAFGMTMVIIAGEIDLSVGSAVAFAGCLVAKLIEAGVPAPAAMLVSLAAGAAGGSLVAVLRSWCRVPSFISTLALLSGLRGAALLVTGGYPVTSLPDWYIRLGRGYLAGVPVPAIAFLAVFAAAIVLMNYTALGRAVYAVGGNAEAARLSGIRVARVRIAVLAATGLLAALGGILLSARLGAGNPHVATGWELDVIAAVIVGGTRLSGGAGSVWGTLVGVVLIGVVIDGMTLMNVSTDWQYVVRGTVVLAAVLVSQLQQRSER
ncbi:MAG: ABC transporter permease [Thermoguttaceae bacterium]|jgi:ribose/xylose/arabinose/galactoside ABC-type transport system permease subunit